MKNIETGQIGICRERLMEMQGAVPVVSRCQHNLDRTTTV